MTGAEGPAETGPELPPGAADPATAHPGAFDPEATDPAAVDPGASEADQETAELIAQIRELAGEDPADVRQVVAEVLAALDRVSGGDLGSRYAAADPDELPSRGDLPPTSP